MTRTTLLVTVALSALTAHASAAPNIVFMFSDDHAYQAIGAYGSKINQTPNIDRIAKQGARFANTFRAEFRCGRTLFIFLNKLHQSWIICVVETQLIAPCGNSAI